MPIDKSSIAAAPPAKTRKPTASTTVAKTPEREEAINGFGQIGQGILIALGKYADAGTIGMHWPNVSREVAKLADTQETIAKLVDPLLQVGPYAALIAVTMPMIMQFAVNHGMASAGAMGTVSKDMLESQIKARLAEMELAALRERQAAEKAAADLKAELDKARKAVA